MTIPSRPAPPPPSNQQNSSNQQQIRNKIEINKLPPPPKTKYEKTACSVLSGTNGPVTKTKHFPQAKMRYEPTTSWDQQPFQSSTTHQFQSSGSSSDLFNMSEKKAPPPRPPPPKRPPPPNGFLKKQVPSQSVNVLSNLFGRKKPTTSGKKSTNTLKTSQLPCFGNDCLSINPINRQSNSPSPSLFYQQHSSQKNSNEFQLITFDSPPSSPTFTQKSNSDCVSVDSFSSDSNFSSPNNGSVSQPESGFEDDFLSSPTDPWESLADPDNTIPQSNYGTLNSLKIAHPVRNLNILSKINKNKTDNPLCNGKNLLPPAPTLFAPTIIKPKTISYQKNVAPKPPLIKEDDSIENDLPMPNCPPPPPPSDSIYCDDDFSSSSTIIDDLNYETESYGIALYDFEGIEDGDLNFKENEKIYLLNQVTDEWYMGKMKNGCEGIFPSNYIDVKVPLKSGAGECTAVSATNANNMLNNNQKIKVMYTFIADQPGDLTIYENDIVMVLYKINDDWLFGECNGMQGQFPSNYIEYVPSNLSLKCP